MEALLLDQMGAVMTGPWKEKTREIVEITAMVVLDWIWKLKLQNIWFNFAEQHRKGEGEALFVRWTERTLLGMKYTEYHKHCRPLIRFGITGAYHLVAQMKMT